MNKKEVLDAISQEFRKSLQDLGVTNGEVIKAMFPDAEWHSAMGQTTIFVPKTAIYNTEVLRVSTDWWNAKYKGVE